MLNESNLRVKRQKNKLSEIKVRLFFTASSRTDEANTKEPSLLKPGWPPGCGGMGWGEGGREGGRKGGREGEGSGMAM